jgi:hypothetical protein
MWALDRLPEFNQIHRSHDATWTATDAASLKFAQGVLFSFLLVTPFWTAVGIGLHLLTR